MSSAFDFADIATMINASVRAGYQLTGVILQGDDGVLVSNRLEIAVPIVDEVLYIDRIPLGMLAAIEVAVPGKVIETLSNPYGIATVFALNAEETKNIVPVARALIGNRSAVVVKTPSGDVKARSIPAGNELLSAGRTTRVDVAVGADAIMKVVGECPKTGKRDVGRTRHQHRRNAGTCSPDYGGTDQQTQQTKFLFRICWR